MKRKDLTIGLRFKINQVIEGASRMTYTIEEIKAISIKDLQMLYFMQQSRCESQEVISQQVRQQAIDMHLDLEFQQSISESLWRLLDDIDTASDMFKPSETNGIKSYKNFYEYAMKKQAERWKFLTNDEKDQNKLVINPKLCEGENV